MVIAWLFLPFVGRGCGCASTRAVDDHAMVGIGQKIGEGFAREHGHHTLLSSGDLAFTAMGSRDLLAVVGKSVADDEPRGPHADSGLRRGAARLEVGPGHNP